MEQSNKPEGFKSMLLQVRLKSLLLCSVLTLVVWGPNYGQTQSQIALAHPDEWPNPKYLSGIYVDTKGCIYLRALTADGLTWEPRLSPAGVHMCGYSPTGAAAMPFVDTPIAKKAQAEETMITPQERPIAKAETPQPAVMPEPVAEAEIVKVAPVAVHIPQAAPTAKVQNVATLVKKSEATRGLFVQVGLYRKPNNAKTTKTKITKLGLTAIAHSIILKNIPMTSIAAGPYSSKFQAQEALILVKKQGYEDAYLR
jgi:hypothetical protein